MDTGKTRACVFCPLGPNREEDETVYMQFLCRGVLRSTPVRGRKTYRSREVRRIVEGPDTETMCFFSGALLEFQVKVEMLGSVDPEFLDWQERNTEWEAEIDEVSTLKGEEKWEVTPFVDQKKEGSEEKVAQQIRPGHSQSFEREIRTV